jgi:hypothetical protein
MKLTMMLVTISMLSTTAFARECNTNARGEVDWKTVCRLDGVSYLTKQCKSIKIPGENPGTYKYENVTKTIGWKSGGPYDLECDVTIHECKAMAEKMLQEYSATDQCGQTVELKKVKFKFDVLNELSLEFKNIHKGKVYR